MTRYLSLTEVLELHRQVIKQSGGKVGLRDLGGLESAVAQPHMAFSGVDLYPTVVQKASALGFSLVKSHPFVDGNKRTRHAAIEVFLVLNGLQINASVEVQESLILGLASGEIDREEFTDWLWTHIQEKEV